MDGADLHLCGTACLLEGLCAAKRSLARRRFAERGRRCLLPHPTRFAARRCRLLLPSCGGRGRKPPSGRTLLSPPPSQPRTVAGPLLRRQTLPPAPGLSPPFRRAARGHARRCVRSADRDARAPVAARWRRPTRACAPSGIGCRLRPSCSARYGLIFRKPPFRKPKPELRNPSSETRAPKPGRRNPKIDPGTAYATAATMNRNRTGTRYL